MAKRRWLRMQAERWIRQRGTTLQPSARCWPWCTTTRSISDITLTGGRLSQKNGPYCTAVADESTRQVARWLENLGEFDFKNQSRLGRRHGNAEGLFRWPPEPDSELPVVGTVTTESFSNWCSKWASAELRKEHRKTLLLAVCWSGKRNSPSPLLKATCKGQVLQCVSCSTIGMRLK